MMWFSKLARKTRKSEMCHAFDLPIKHTKMAITPRGSSAEKANRCASANAMGSCAAVPVIVPSRSATASATPMVPAAGPKDESMPESIPYCSALTVEKAALWFAGIKKPEVAQV